VGEVVMVIEIVIVGGATGCVVARIGMVGMVVGAARGIIGVVVVVPSNVIGTVIVEVAVVHAGLPHFGTHIAHATTEVTRTAAEVAAAKPTTETATEVAPAKATAACKCVGGETNGAERDADGQGNDGAANHDRSSGVMTVAVGRRATG
jgi:hypothetical protein